MLVSSFVNKLELMRERAETIRGSLLEALLEKRKTQNRRVLRKNHSIELLQVIRTVEYAARNTHSGNVKATLI